MTTTDDDWRRVPQALTSDYKHPDSGRIYREGDPAHHFARLVAGLARECDEFLRHYRDRLADRDYLGQHSAWPSDPERIARAMAHTIAAIDRATTDVVVDRDAHRYGLGDQDDEWQRKYG
ncbi:MAG: hypothetical protein ACRD0W_11665 [Acidimicrobiales bacterium]